MAPPKEVFLSPGLDLETLLGLGDQGKREGVPLNSPWVACLISDSVCWNLTS
jgi:hypothetical protein